MGLFIDWTRNVHKRFLQCFDAAFWLTVRTSYIGCLGGVMVRASDLQSSGRGFDSRVGPLSSYLGKLQSSIRISGVGKSSTGLSGWG